MMSIEQLLGCLELCGQPACEVALSGTNNIKKRTPAFVALMQEWANVVDEASICDAVQQTLNNLSHENTDPSSHIKISQTEWECVVIPTGDTAVAIFPMQGNLHFNTDNVFRSIAENSPDIISRFDKNLRHIYVNQAIAEATDLSADDFMGKDHFELGMPTELSESWREVYQKVFQTGMEGSKEFDFPTPMGVRHYISRVVPELDEQGNVHTILSFARDITERRRLEQKLQVMAETDSLTGLYNRRQFIRRADREINRARRYKNEFSILLIDIDNFKNINDQFGHAAGDQALRLISEVLRQETRATDFSGRLGGDEFCHAIINAAKDEAKQLAERMCRRISQINEIENNHVQISASIGLATLSAEDSDVLSIIKRADVLMYQAKSNGKNQVVMVTI